MKVAFVGPSAPDADKLFRTRGIEIRGPAARGDIAEAVLDGVSALGLVDGTFEANAAVWHKEILFALSHGVQVSGAASMGALRAVECERYGMIGVGTIFEDYATGRLLDDDAVALLHTPEELGYAGLSEPLVIVNATSRVLRSAGLISAAEESALTTVAGTLFFKDRTFDRIVDQLTLQEPSREKELRALLATYRRDQKREDAMDLLDRLAAAPDVRGPPPQDWQFMETLSWQEILNDVKRRRQAKELGTA